MALLRYRLARTVDTYVVIDHGDPEIDDDGNARYTETGKTVVHEEPLTPAGKAACQYALLQGNAQERADRQAQAAPVVDNDPAAEGTLGTANTGAAAVSGEEG